MRNIILVFIFLMTFISCATTPKVPEHISGEKFVNEEGLYCLSGDYFTYNSHSSAIIDVFSNYPSLYNSEQNFFIGLYKDFVIYRIKTNKYSYRITYYRYNDEICDIEETDSVKVSLKESDSKEKSSEYICATREEFEEFKRFLEDLSKDSRYNSIEKEKFDLMLKKVNISKDDVLKRKIQEELEKYRVSNENFSTILTELQVNQPIGYYGGIKFKEGDIFSFKSFSNTKVLDLSYEGDYKLYLVAWGSLCYYIAVDKNTQLKVFNKPPHFIGQNFKIQYISQEAVYLDGFNEHKTYVFKYISE